MKLLAVAVAGPRPRRPGEPVVRADDEALLRGRAAFETTRVYGGRPFRLDEHLERLAASARAHRAPGRRTARCRAARRGRARGRRRAGRGAAPLLDAGATLVATVGRLDPARARGRCAARGIALVSLARRRAAPALAARRRQVDELRGEHGRARPRRAARGADDAVFLADGDIVLEAPITNIWWRRGDTLYTPSLDVGILAGVTRATLLELAPDAGYAVEEGASRSTSSRRRGGVHLVVDPRADAGRRARRPPIGDGRRPPHARCRRRCAARRPSG